MLAENDFDNDDYDDGPWTCGACGGDGEIMWCPDDICRGGGECIHGDGMMACPSCKGTGETFGLDVCDLRAPREEEQSNG